MLTAAVRASADRSVLCWLATVDADGQPNVSPKEIWTVFDDRHLVIADIASPGSARNLAAPAKACVSFVDVFVQKGFKVAGTGRRLAADDPEFARWAAPLLPMAGPRFPLRGVFVIEAARVTPIVAPSWAFYPDETTEAGQVAQALGTYGVSRP
ncbi:MAG: pyridoxamine 5'-phosphate oxidase family protein [Candidatus Eisenbacteria bacterium]